MKKLLIVVLAVFAVGCVEERPKPTKITEAMKSQQVANNLTFTENSERDNIEKRLKLTASPSLLGYVVLMNEAGQPVLYTSVKGKITSGSKRLTSPQRKVNNRYSQSHGQLVMQAPSDEGTWGSSSPYIYFWDTNGKYHQWNGKYLYSDAPIRLRVKPLVIQLGEDK